MDNNDAIVGLDIGSGRITCVVGTRSPDAGTVTALADARVPCRGLDGGMVTRRNG